jgi:type I restriction enzyme S subunit
MCVPDRVEQHRIVTLLDEAFEGIATAKAHAEQNLRNAESLFFNEVENLFACPPQDWREVPLGAAGNTQTGSSPKSSDLASFGSDVPFIKPGDFNRDGTLNYENDGLSFLGAERARLVQPGSVLMVCIGTLGKVGYNDRVVSMNQQINSWTPSAGVLPKFMYYQMLSSDFQHRVRSNAGQTTLAIINKSKWSALTVRIPNEIKVQRDVVARLDEFMEASVRLKAIYQRKLTALTELQQSLLHQAFTGQL